MSIEGSEISMSARGTVSRKAYWSVEKIKAFYVTTGRRISVLKPTTGTHIVAPIIIHQEMKCLAMKRYHLINRQYLLASIKFMK